MRSSATFNKFGLPLRDTQRELIQIDMPTPEVVCALRQVFHERVVDFFRFQADDFVAVGGQILRPDIEGSSVVRAKRLDCLLYTSPSPRDRG